MKLPDGYNYFDNLVKHVGKDYRFFHGKFVYPRQLEIHLPGNGKRACRLHCSGCQGSLYTKSLGKWELTGLGLLNNLKGQVPYHIYGGAYTEPLMNPFLTTYLATTKKYGNHFGIHTNGVLLKNLEDNFGFLTYLSEWATDSEDYLSISLDGGIAEDWAKYKRVKDESLFDGIIKGIYQAAKLRKKHSLRICFLISEHTGNYENFEAITRIARETQVDSLRFSIPYAIYNQDFLVLEKYRDKVEKPMHKKYVEMLQPFLQLDKSVKPYIFYVDPVTTSFDQYNFKKCIYSYYQITLGADGYLYRCSAVAAPDAKNHRLGKITSDLDEFNKSVLANYNEDWDCQEQCFAKGLRCNRMAIECNHEYERIL